MPLIVVLREVIPSDLVSMEQFFLDQLVEDDRDIIADDAREVVLIRENKAPPTIVEHTVDYGHLPRELVYVSLPVGGYRIRSLPARTKLKCWFCDLQFSDHPWFIPYDMQEEKNNIVTLVASGISGNFCSEVCAYGWLPQLESGSIDRYSQLLQIQVLARKGVSSFRIPDPLHKTEREEYGGGMTEKAFREELAARCI